MADAAVPLDHGHVAEPPSPGAAASALATGAVGDCGASTAGTFE